MDDFTKTYAQIIADIKADPENQAYTVQGWEPMLSIHPEATILIIGQAPSRKVQAHGVMWDDQSGDRLREWLGIDRTTFYNSNKLAVIPMDFYFPGKAKNGGDELPRKAMAPKYHPRLLALMPNLKAYVLVGNTAIHYYLNLPSSATLTKAVHALTIPKNQQATITILPLPHPSPRNNIWLAKNAWFIEEKVPALRTFISQQLKL
ncbi:uracil DNA glycosylase [Weissella oryzae SG25]|uniref:Uracil DNA glycosylase n=1 Tax=Weissella oryzae (strain DSM 25784 / JCM 18191 / LMG 30913 / SG25) TaxID=1329250 RepID=A0A069CSE3_WEIOS|nr:uracil-DNA glycosylase family protein [Weissella oryzae]GAK30287.1 uracil DNA glycosylase [Weissella oryzae SG25]